ncbi:MAG: TolC family protein [Aureliella sp.]
MPTVVITERTVDTGVMKISAPLGKTLEGESRRRAPSTIRLGLCLLMFGVVTGCQTRQAQRLAKMQRPPAAFTLASYGSEFASIACEPSDVELTAAPPLSRLEELPEDFLTFSLDEVVQLSLQNTEVLRDLGATVLRNPQASPTVYDPAIQSTNPVFGIEAALSAFDAQFNSVMNYANNDDVFNNLLIGGGVNEVKQRLTTGQLGLSKTSATGTQYSITNGIENDINNRTNNLFGNSWTSFFEAEMRQPLMQGAGLEFNRIAGPNGQPGLVGSNGVLIARINNDISVAQLERNLINFVSDVVNGYWQLVFAYENYDAILRARTGAVETWTITKSRFDNDLPGGEADREAQAREQMLTFEGRLVVALTGDNQTGATGILQAEANLRRLLNMPQSDGRLIRPSEAPDVMSIVHDWPTLVAAATARRVEVREQQWRIKRREMELLAAKNFLLPRVDALATYRNNGFGENLAGGGVGRFPSALKIASDGDYQEFEFGVEVTAPIGFRRASAAVRHANLQLARERALLIEQQRQIAHDLGSAVRQLTQTTRSAEVAYERLLAAKQTVDARLAAFEAEATPFDELLEAQRRLADAEVNYHRQTTAWARAIAAVSRESGELLERHFIQVSEEPGGVPSTGDLERKSRAIGRVNSGSYGIASPGFVSQN